MKMAEITKVQNFKIWN